MPDVNDRHQAVQPLLDAAGAAYERGDWSSAVTIAQAAAALDPQDPAVVGMLATASAAASGPGARRRLTVMFCDLAGSTEIASALDPEDTREVLNDYYELCAEAVGRHGGHIGHLVGDGVLIYFGYPQAHEDDGLRAVLTALAIADAVKKLRLPTQDPPSALQVRVGIHTGLAVISDLGRGDWASFDEVVGETPNLAARLQAAGSPGEVLISADTLDLVRDHVDVRPLGAQSLKGINRPVELFQVLCVRQEDDERSRDPTEMVTVGRKAERAMLERAWQETSDRSGYVVITGEPGIGKSHLTRFARGLVTDPARSLVLRCSALHSNTPLYPVAQLLLSPGISPEGFELEDPLVRLSGVAERLDGDSAEHLYLLARMASVPWPTDRESPELQPEQVRERTLGLLCSWFDSLARDAPLLLIVEDLHWADPSTIDLLQRLTDPRPYPMLLLVTTRLAPETVPGEPTCVIGLAAIGPAESHELIHKLTGGRIDQATRTLVAERGDGVPLYLRELANMLDPESGSRPGGAASVPPTLNDLLVARLDAYSQHRDAVEALAVLGRAAAPELVSSVTARPVGEVQHQLESLQRAGILRASAAPPRYDFHHTLLRDAAYDGQLLTQRRQLHRRAAEALESTYAAPYDDDPQELAHHYHRAGAFEPAVKLWIRAALRDASVAAHVEAIKSYELALSHLHKVGGEVSDLELQAQSGLAASLLASRGYAAPEVAAAYGRVRELSIARDAQLEVSGLYGLWAYYHVTGDAPASLETAETMLERAIASGDQPATLAANAVLGYQLQRLGRPGDALALLTQGRQWDAGEPLFPHHAGIGADANLAMTQWLIGDFAAARESIRRAVSAADALNGPMAHFTRAYTHAFAAELFQVAGRADLASQHAGRVVQVASEFGFASWLAAGMTNLKIAEALLGDLGAIPTIEHCLGAWRAAGASSSLTQFGLGLAQSYRAAARTAEALTTVDQALACAAGTRELYLEPELYRLRGELLIELERDDAAGVEALEQALASARQSGSHALELSALLSIEQRRRDGGGARTTVQEITRLLGRLDPVGDDPEGLLVRARALIEREPAR